MSQLASCDNVAQVSNRRRCDRKGMLFAAVHKPAMARYVSYFGTAI
jgi:hypothetical protein